MHYKLKCLCVKNSNEFLHLVDCEESWRPYLLNFQFPVLDLGIIPDQKLSEDRRLQARLLAMKYATRKKQQMAVRERLIEALKNAPEDLGPVIYYLISVYVYDEQTLREIIREVKPEEESQMMSQFAQDITRAARQEALREGIQQGMQKGMQQGMQQGVQQGRQEGRQEGLLEGEVKGEAKLLLRQLSRRFGPLPNEITERIHTADPSTIERWADRVLDAKSLDDVFSD